MKVSNEVSNKIKLANRSLKKNTQPTKNVLYPDQIHTVPHDVAYGKSLK